MISYTYSSRPRTLSDEEIVRLYVGGLDSDTIGARANCSPTVVLDLVRAAGQQVRRPGGRPHNVAMPDEEVCRRYRKGDSGPAIARAAKCTPSAVYLILRKHGVERRASVAQTAAATAAAARRRRAPP